MSDRLPLDTHTDRLRAIEAVPQTLKYAMEGNPHYASLLWETYVGFAFLAFTPWRLLD